MKAYTSVLFSLLFITSIEAQQISTNLPLDKGQSGDTLVYVTDAFDVYNRTYVPVDSISVRWSGTTQTFEVTGEAISTLIDKSVHFFFGVQDSARLVINSDSTKQKYVPALIDTFILSGQAYVGFGHKTTYTYDTEDQLEKIYGAVRIVIGNKSYIGQMGSADDPGTTIHQNAIQKVWVHLLGAIELLGLPANDSSKTDIILQHQASDPQGTYYGHGTWLVYMMDDVQLAKLGTASKPGIVIKNGSLDSVNMLTAGGGFLFGFLPVLDALSVQYSHQHQKYSISGLINVGIPLGGFFKLFGAKYTPSFEIDAGDTTTAGFLLDPVTGHFEVEDATFQLKGVNGAAKVSQGGFDINDVAVKIVNNRLDSINARLTLPPGFSVENSWGFTYDPNANPGERFKVNSFNIQYEAKVLSEGIPLGASGFTIVKIQGSVDNIAEPKDLTLNASMGLIFGDIESIPVSVFGLSGVLDVASLYIEGDVELSLKALTATVAGDYFAYFSAGEWIGLVGQLATGTEMIWGKSYNMGGSYKVFVPPSDFLDAVGTMTLAGKDIDAIFIVELKVPHSIPIIGGKRLTSIHGALRHKNMQAAQSYAAGWTQVNVPFDHFILGAKANFKSNSISKVGAAQEKAITKQVTSDQTQHPLINGVPQTNWYQCSLTHTFTLESSRPAAYLQNQLIIDNFKFQDPLMPNTYFSPASATITSASSGTDLKILTPNDADSIYLNEGQTVPQNNTMSVDFSQNTLPGDTIRWITINSAAQSYGSIDWVHQPDVLLTPGEYTLNVSGYCPTDGEPLEDDDMIYSASPVYPRPTISLMTSGTSAFTMTYSAYLTDSTRVSLYWTYDTTSGGTIIDHLDYYDGDLVGDSLYQWNYTNWDPGIVSEEVVYVYAVIDDFINHPVRSGFKPLYFDEDMAVTIAGAQDSTEVVLIPADSTAGYIKGILNSEGFFGFYNVPLGTYTIHCFGHSPDVAFELFLNVANIDGNVITTTYHSPEWISAEFTVLSWDNGAAQISASLLGASVQLFGDVEDTSGVSVNGTTVFVLNSQDSVLQSFVVSDLGYIITGLDTGYVSVAVALPEANNYQWPINRDLQYVESLLNYGLLLMEDSVHISSSSRGLDFLAYAGEQGPVFSAIDLDDNPVDNVVISLQLANGTGPVYRAATNENGLAFFEGDEFMTFTTYSFSTAWPAPYHAVTQDQTFEWTGYTGPQPVIGSIE